MKPVTATLWARLLAAALLVLAGWTLGAHSSLARDLDETEGVDSPDGDAFQIGSSCAAMAYLERTQLKYLTSPSFKDEFQSFCYPEEPFDCTDYTALLKGLGTLEAGLDGYYCRFQPK